MRGKAWRVFTVVWLLVTVCLALVVLLTDGISWFSRAGALLNALAAVTFLLLGRSGTRADTGGVAVTDVVTRRFPWAEVVELGPLGEGRWAVALQARLANGKKVTLVGVPVDDLPVLEALRAGR